MDADAARAHLGVAADVGAEELRRAYREQLFALHPDRAGAGGDAVRSVIDAYRLLRAEPIVGVSPGVAVGHQPAPAASGPSPGIQDDMARGVWLVGRDTIALACPADEACLRLIEVAHLIGDVTYVDPSCGLMEALLRTKDGTTLSLVISLQGRAVGHTEAFLTLEPLDAVRGRLPLIADITQMVASYLR